MAGLLGSEDPTWKPTYAPYHIYCAKTKGLDSQEERGPEYGMGQQCSQ